MTLFHWNDTLPAIEHGLTNAGLAAHFDVSEAAIASRLHRFYERTAMAGRIEAVLWSYEHLGCCVAAKLG
jgi:DNA-binding NarL/FixJ family response regulator